VSPSETLIPPAHTTSDAVATVAGGADAQPRELTPRELGRRIKLLRVSRELTLKDLEERGGISATHISEIERGKASPTVGALGRIARALGLPPATLVEPTVLPQVAITRAAARADGVLHWGKASFVPLVSPVQGGSTGTHLLTLPIGREPALTHSHEGEEWCMSLSGVAEIRVDQETFVLREGDSIHFRAHRPHAYSNLASNPAVLLVASRPRLAI
jgi:quercetin dioxygenase-like cupin family protein/DNA-binding Xre family transcriptional regulator